MIFGQLKALWHYRYFIVSSIKTEFLSRFARSKLGALWVLIHPMSQVVVYSFVLSNILSARLPSVNIPYAYSVYLMAGILAWSLFSEILTRMLTVFIDNGNTLKKITFPKITLPIIVAGSAIVNNTMLFVAMLIIYIIIGHYPTAQLLWLIPLTAIVIALASSLGLILAVINVFIRDVGQAVTIGLQFLFWFTPIVYVTNIIPEKYLFLLSLNPLYHIVTSYQQVLVFKATPDILAMMKVAFICLILMVFATIFFKRANEEIVDML